MSKSCWRPSRFHVTVFPARAAQLRRIVTHAWAVIISHTAVSRGVSGPTMLLRGCPGWVLVGFTAAGAPGEATSFPPPLEDLPHRRARAQEPSGSAQACHTTARHGSAMLSTVHRNSLTLTHMQRTLPLFHLSLSLSLTLTAATPVDADAAVEPLLNYFLPHFRFQREFIPLHPVSSSRSSVLQRRQSLPDIRGGLMGGGWR